MHPIGILPMHIYRLPFRALTALVAFLPTPGTAAQPGPCLAVSGEKIEVRNLGAQPIVDDRDGTPDFAATSLVKSVTDSNGTVTHNILITGVKRDSKKTIAAFSVKVDEQTLSYPEDACGK